MFVRPASGTIWSDVLTAAVNLPADHPGKDAIITALDAAAYTATKAVPAMFSDQWYVRALASIRAQEPSVSNALHAMIVAAYARQHRRMS